MRAGRLAWLAWSLAGACVALVLASLALLLVVAHAGDVSSYYYEDAAVAVAVVEQTVQPTRAWLWLRPPAAGSRRAAS